MADYSLPKIPADVSDAEVERALDQFEREDGKLVARTEQLPEPVGDLDYLDTFLSEETPQGEFKPVPLPPAIPPPPSLFVRYRGALSGVAVAASFVAWFVMHRPAVPEFPSPPSERAAQPRDTSQAETSSGTTGQNREAVTESASVLSADRTRPAAATPREPGASAPPANPDKNDTRPPPGRAVAGTTPNPNTTITRRGTVDPVLRPLEPVRAPAAATASPPAERTTALPVDPPNSGPLVVPSAPTADALELTSAGTGALATPAVEPPAQPSLPPAPDLAQPPSTPATAASASATSASPPPTGEPASEPPPPAADTAAIETVLGRYRSAFSALDVGAARAVWPSVNERALDRAFDRLEKQELSFNRCWIGVAGARAEADCSGTVRYVPKVGSRDLQVDSRTWKFGLRKVSDGWSIETVEAR
ncbi:MAG TPA: hypothetical protein VM818_05350 [Vicinamibacterales bacterium]|nr:hypothetical protein [Vicinamibacterales bacterium]